MSFPINPGTQVANLYGDLGGSKEVTRITVDQADESALEVQLITFPAGDEAAQADFILLENVAGDQVAVWLDLDADGTDPDGVLATAADAKVMVAVTVTGTPSTAAEVAAAAKAAIELNGTLDDVTIVDNEDGTLTITQDLMGNVAAPVPKDAAETGVGTILGSTVVAGSDTSSFQETYLTLKDSDANAFYAWFNVNGEGSDPSETGTALEVAIAAGASASAIGAALAAAIDAEAAFDADHEGNGVVKVAVLASAAAVDATAGDAPVTVSVPFQGYAAKINAAGSPSDISNNPAAF